MAEKSQFSDISKCQSVFLKTHFIAYIRKEKCFDNETCQPIQYFVANILIKKVCKN